MSQQQIGSVVIGRNEGERLRVCLQSLLVAAPGPVVYVDSGSTDGSVALARGLGAHVVALDMSRPFTAARARNAGLERLVALAPDLAWVQFIDGDCELQASWPALALAFLQGHPQAAVACGRRRERFPLATLYNSQCDDEWNTPVGLAQACGGDALMRVAALRQVGGYDPLFIAGEEPEMCVRLRQAGWTVHRLDAEMTLHDAAITRLGQWWQRARRAGHAYAQGHAKHGGLPERHGLQQLRRALLWGLLLPVLALVGGAVWPPLALLALAYPLQWLRLAQRMPAGVAWPVRKAGLLVLGKLAEAHGALTFYANRLRQRQMRLIEYK